LAPRRGRVSNLRQQPSVSDQGSLRADSVTLGPAISTVDFQRPAVRAEAGDHWLILRCQQSRGAAKLSVTIACGCPVVALTLSLPSRDSCRDSPCPLDGSPSGRQDRGRQEVNYAQSSMSLRLDPRDVGKRCSDTAEGISNRRALGLLRIVACLLCGATASPWLQPLWRTHLR
jgi:hypothetical protein